jgi:hypothetical protein
MKIDGGSALCEPKRALGGFENHTWCVWKRLLLQRRSSVVSILTNQCFIAQGPTVPRWHPSLELVLYPAS